MNTSERNEFHWLPSAEFIFGAFHREDKEITQVTLLNILTKLRVFKLYFALFIFRHVYFNLWSYIFEVTGRNSISPNVCSLDSHNPKFTISYGLTPNQEIFLQYECIHLKTIDSFLIYGLSHSWLILETHKSELALDLFFFF